MRTWYPPGAGTPSGQYVPTSDYEDADVLAKLLNVDGATSGLDADLLDGQHAATFAASNHSHAHLNEYIIGCQTNGAPAANQLCLIHLLPIEITLDLNTAGCAAYCKTRPTGSPVFTLAYIRPSDGYSVTIGTITFTPASNSGTLGSAEGKTIPAGRYLQLLAPATPDATLSDLSFTFIGVKT